MPERGPARGLAAVDSASAAGALAQYATLRQRYYGSAAYDFSRGVLTSVAEQLMGRGSAAEGEKPFVQQQIDRVMKP